jgi:histidinol-phosphatase (PHP family)
MWGNLHTHTCFSDGSDLPEAYLKEAISKGFQVLGFSDHSPIPLDNSFSIREGKLSEYCRSVSRLKARDIQVPEIGRLDLLLGIEYDYIPGRTVSVTDLRNSCGFDFIIGSVHLITGTGRDPVWFIDGPNQELFDAGIRDVFAGDVRCAVTAYWRQVQQMIVSERPDIIGHLDKIKMHNKARYFKETESWYIALVEETLELISQSGAVVEINTRGLYKNRADSLYPGPAILEKMLPMGIPVMITSDAHRPEELILGFPEARSVLQSIGFRSTWLLTSGGWKEIPLDSFRE